MITYACQVEFGSPDDEKRVLETLRLSKELYGYFSAQAYPIFEQEGRIRLMQLHNMSYVKVRETFPTALSQMVIKAENDVVATYTSIRSNKHQITKAPVRRNGCLRLDKRLHTWVNPQVISMAAVGGKRIQLTLNLYPKLSELLSSCTQTDPLLYQRDGKVFLALTFVTPEIPSPEKLAVGVDLGMRFLAVTSEGKAIKGNCYNAIKRKIRHLKSALQSKGSKAAKKRLKQLKKKEANLSKNYTHLVANELLKTQADTLVLEELDLKKMKRKNHQKQNKSKVNQIPMKKLRDVVTYKAKALGKTVITVSPAYTSQKDYRGLENGERRGRRYYTKDGLVFDADLNAAINIAAKSGKHSVSFVEPLDGSLKPVNGQGTVNCPIAGSLYGSLVSPTARQWGS
jgi:IS605 OrfB family transposase